MFPQGYFYILSCKHGFALDVYDGQTKEDANIIVWPQKFEDSDNQLWSYDNGRLINKKSGHALDIRSSAFKKDKVIIQNKRKDKNQSQFWVFDQGFICSQEYQSMVFDIKGDSEKGGAQVLLYKRKESDNLNQKWYIESYHNIEASLNLATKDIPLHKKQGFGLPQPGYAAQAGAPPELKSVPANNKISGVGVNPPSKSSSSSNLNSTGPPPPPKSSASSSSLINNNNNNNNYPPPPTSQTSSSNFYPPPSTSQTSTSNLYPPPSSPPPASSPSNPGYPPPPSNYPPPPSSNYPPPPPSNYPPPPPSNYPPPPPSSNPGYPPSSPPPSNTGYTPSSGYPPSNDGGYPPQHHHQQQPGGYQGPAAGVGGFVLPNNNNPPPPHYPPPSDQSYYPPPQ